MYLLKQKKSLDAVEFALDIFTSISNTYLNYFNLLWFARVTNDTILAGIITKFKKYISIVDFQYAQLNMCHRIKRYREV